MNRENSYLDRKGRAFDLRLLDEEERQLVADLLRRAEANPDWSAFEAHWLAAVAALYDGRGLSRKESRQTAVYLIAQDLSSRLAVAAGLARVSDYRDDLEELVRSRFGTQRAFCEATGLSEDMVSHVLARRKHLAIDTLTQALKRIGCALHIVPTVDEGSAKVRGGTGNGNGKQGTPMNEDFRRKMRAIDSKIKHGVEQEFAGVREWYQSLPANDRRKFKQDVQALAEVADRMELTWSMFTKARWSCEQYDDEGNCLYSIGATQSPKEWLRAIEQWDDTEDLEGGDTQGA